MINDHADSSFLVNTSLIFPSEPSTSDSSLITPHSVCASCLRPIVDHYVLRAGELSYHEACARCFDCGERVDNLGGRWIDGQLYCWQHRSRLCCAGCRGVLEPTDLVYRVKPHIVFHIACHRCCQCFKPLGPGERILADLERRTVACAEHLDGVMSEEKRSDEQQISTTTADTQSSPQVAISSTDSRSLPPLPQYPFEMYTFGEQYIEESKMLKRRGPRTTIGSLQLDVLNRVFANSPKPSKHMRAKLAAETGLSMRVIQVWFQVRLEWRWWSRAILLLLMTSASTQLLLESSKERRLKHLVTYLHRYEHSDPTLAPIPQTVYSHTDMSLVDTICAIETGDREGRGNDESDESSSAHD